MSGKRRLLAFGVLAPKKNVAVTTPRASFNICIMAESTENWTEKTQKSECKFVYTSEDLERYDF